MHASPWPTPRVPIYSPSRPDPSEFRQPFWAHQMRAAFPFELRDHVEPLSERTPRSKHSISDWLPMRLAAEAVALPGIIYNDPIAPADFQSLSETQQAMALALYTAHHDGYIRADAVAQLVARREPWIAPFLLLRLGDMVEQVIEPISAVFNAGGAAAETLRLMLADSATLNPFVFRTVRSRSVGYWYTYYSREHPSREGHPGVSACKAIAAAVEPGALLKW